MKTLLSFKYPKSLLVIFAMIGADLAAADIYRYQDEKGRWHYTDKPPAGNKKVDVLSRSTDDAKNSNPSVASTSQAADLRKALFEKFDPKTPVEQATLAVVTIETVMGTGSGFFVSENCHLVTNRHVLRPSETEYWEKEKKKYEDEKKKLAKEKLSLKEEQERLARYERSLQKHKQYIDTLPQGNERRQEQKEYEQYFEIYQKDLDVLQAARQTLKARQKEFEERMSEFSLNSSLAAVARMFKVIMKDGSERKAQLVHLSRDTDLALLRIDDCRSPFLETDSAYQPVQGARIYSIGSPLGQRDHLTSGVITNVKDDAITIDAQILPGNSGGPLINEKGKLIGVNTLKLSVDNPNSQGFGISIPVRLVEKELGSYIR